MQKFDFNPATTLLTILTLGICRFFGVPEGTVGVVTAFGRFVRLANPGLGRCLYLWGLYEKPAFLVATFEQQLPSPNEIVFTRDRQKCSIDVVVFFRIIDAQKAAFDVQDHRLAILNLVKATLRNECGEMDLQQLLAGRERVARELQTQLDAGTSPWGITVRLVEITEIQVQS